MWNHVNVRCTGKGDAPHSVSDRGEAASKQWSIVSGAQQRHSQLDSSNQSINSDTVTFGKTDAADSKGAFREVGIVMQCIKDCKFNLPERAAVINDQSRRQQQIDCPAATVLAKETRFCVSKVLIYLPCTQAN